MVKVLMVRICDETTGGLGACSTSYENIEVDKEI
jgi:hypothetical protein